MLIRYFSRYRASCRLADLRAAARIAILTSSRHSIANRILNAIGLNSIVFDGILAGEELHQPKPSPVDLERLIAMTGGSVSDSVVIGDRWEVDLRPALDLGMRIVHVTGRDQVLAWIREEASALRARRPTNGST